ncbi:hypothetical protein ACLOJK_029368 [Asimina triloba]
MLMVVPLWRLLLARSRWEKLLARGITSGWKDDCLAIGSCWSRAVYGCVKIAG